MRPEHAAPTFAKEASGAREADSIEVEEKESAKEAKRESNWKKRKEMEARSKRK